MNVYKIIGFYELLGCILGIWSTLRILIPNLHAKYVEYYLICLTFLYLLVGVSGLLLLFKKTISKFEKSITAFAQITQILNFSIHGVEYSFQAGTLMGLRANHELKVILEIFQPMYKISFISEDKFILINLVPVLIIVSVLRNSK